MSHSSVENKYRSMTTTSCEFKCLKRLVLFLGVTNKSPAYLYHDSQTTLHITTSPIYHEMTKHIEIDYRFVQDEIQGENIATSHVRNSCAYL